MLHIRVAKKAEYSKVRAFYHSVIDAMEDAEYKPQWEKDVYPSQEFLMEAIECGELYIGELNGEIAACMVVNHKYNEEYKEITWSVEAADEEILVIHALGVHPMFSGQGIATQMVQEVIRLAHENSIKAIRLDVLMGNVPAERVYRKIGFQYLNTIQMFYEDTGWTDFKIFEFIV